MSMAVNYEVITYEGREARLYPDGSIRNEKGHMIAPLPGKHTITQEDAASLAKRKHERKREIIAKTAAAAVERDDYRKNWGDDAWIAAVAEAQYIKATTPDDPKSTQAAAFLFREAGIAEGKQDSDNVQTVAQAAAIGAGVASALERVLRDVMGRDIVDGTATDSGGGGAGGEENGS